MAISEYIESLKQTKTYLSQTMSLQEYHFKKILGIKRLPPIPSADENRHVVVMKVFGNQPSLLTVLTSSKDKLETNSKDADKLLFIFINKRPRALVINSPNEGYSLKDGHQINASFRISYQVKDAREFWNSGQDPIADFESAVTDEAKNFLLTCSSYSLISDPADLKKALEKRVENANETGITVVKNGLETNIKDNCKTGGLDLLKVTADIVISEFLKQHLQRGHNEIYRTGGLLERMKIDELIKRDYTYSPYSLQEVIMALNPELIYDFYELTWKDAMKKVSQELNRKRTEFQNYKVNKLKEAIKTAYDMKLDEQDISDLKVQLAEELKKIAGPDEKSKFGVQNFLLQIAPPSSNEEASRIRSEA